MDKKINRRTMQTIYEMKAAGKSYAQICRATGVSERTLYNMDHDRVKCSTCIYRATGWAVNNCDYICFTGEMRGCKADECNRYVKGARLRRSFSI